MKTKRLLYLLFSVIVSTQICAQQKVADKGMTYIILAKPNSIIYHDTLYQGANQFKPLFEATHDVELMSLYHKHQTNKIWGSVLGTTGALGLLVGVKIASDNQVNSQSIGWAAIGGGFLTSLLGGYLINISKTHLYRATEIFNKNYTSKPSACLGISNSGGIGLVVKL